MADVGAGVVGLLVEAKRAQPAVLVGLQLHADLERLILCRAAEWRVRWPVQLSGHAAGVLKLELASAANGLPAMSVTPPGPPRTVAV